MDGVSGTGDVTLSQLDLIPTQNLFGTEVKRLDGTPYPPGKKNLFQTVAMCKFIIDDHKYCIEIITV